MADDAQFDPLAGIMTPGVLANDRQKLFQSQMAQAGQQDGWGYGARAAGLTLGNALGQMGQGPMDRMAAQNQQLLTQPTEVQASGDTYTDQAAKYDELAKRFLAAGNPQQASKFVQAGQIVRQEGQRAQAETAKTEMEQAKTTEAKVGAQWAIVDTTPDKNGIPQYKRIGEPISLFNADGSVNKDFGSQRAQAMADAAKDGAGNLTSMRVDQLESSKAQSASIRANQAIATAGIKAATAAAKTGGELTPEGLATLAVQHVFQGPSALARMDPATRKQVIDFEANKGLSPIDGVSAQAEIRGINSAASKIGGREGNIAILSKSMEGAGQQVLETLGNVDRGSIQKINGLVAAGKKQFGNAAEARYAAAIQTFVNEYSRVIGGGSGQVTDSAKAEAHELLNTAQSPEAVKAVVDQLANRETKIVQEAGDSALEYIANPSRYKALKKIQSAAGLPITALLGDPDTPMPGGAASGPSTGQVAPPGAPPAATVAVPTATGPNGQKVYFRNGQWGPQ